MSRTKIAKKIVGYGVKPPAAKPAEAAKPEVKPEVKRGSEPGARPAEVIRMHEKLERPEMLIGSTYKVKTPVSDHAMYVTIN
ncbi:MAG TPA: NrdJb, partial [Woeseiaceae bacterium]|nr:NrdJb [Woeseiaceae bacterium]